MHTVFANTSSICAPMFHPRLPIAQVTPVPPTLPVRCGRRGPQAPQANTRAAEIQRCQGWVSRICLAVRFTGEPPTTVAAGHESTNAKGPGPIEIHIRIWASQTITSTEFQDPLQSPNPAPRLDHWSYDGYSKACRSLNNHLGRKQPTAVGRSVGNGCNLPRGIPLLQLALCRCVASEENCWHWVFSLFFLRAIFGRLT